jgi:hypothetical protein
LLGITRENCFNEALKIKAKKLPNHKKSYHFYFSPMNPFEHDLQLLREPSNYFEGRCRSTNLPLPRNILFFLRDSKSTLQQEAIQNRSHHRHVLAFNLLTEGRVHIDHLSLGLAPGQAVLIFPLSIPPLQRPCLQDVAVALLHLRDRIFGRSRAVEGLGGDIRRPEPGHAGAVAARLA